MSSLGGGTRADAGDVRTFARGRGQWAHVENANYDDSVARRVGLQGYDRTATRQKAKDQNEQETCCHNEPDNFEPTGPCLLILLVILLSTISPLAGAEPEAANVAASAAVPPATIRLPAKVLRGYGELSAVFQSMQTADGAASLTRITCQSAEKALLVQAKYLSDVGLLPGCDADTVPSFRDLPRRRAPAGGAVACSPAGARS